MALQFEWDDNKAIMNKHKHGITFEEATTAFGDGLSITISDPLYSESEERFILIGLSKKHSILVVVHIERKETIRIISARKATKKEQKFYEECI
jgi:uncharacterized DUF497 family protein